MKKTFIIAEAGVNHNGSTELARRLIDIASDAGADAVKFQTFLAEKGITVRAPKAIYQRGLTSDQESQFEMIKRLELSYDAHVELIDYCKTKKIQFLSTACDLESVDLLERFNVPAYKVSSCDLVNIPLLRYIGRLRKKVIISTGMATLGEVEFAVRTLKNCGTDDPILLHCTTEYPCPPDEINLNKMITLRNAFGLEIGFSDHSEGITASVAAVALGATVIEKHFTISKDLEGPDHKASLGPDELVRLVHSVREVERAMGNPAFVPTASELANREMMRRKLVASKVIRKGEIITPESIGCKRAEGGMTPDYYDLIVGRSAVRDFEPDDVIIL